jgi:hypothetical protein
MKRNSKYGISFLHRATCLQHELTLTRADQIVVAPIKRQHLSLVPLYQDTQFYPKPLQIPSGRLPSHIYILLDYGLLTSVK